MHDSIFRGNICFPVLCSVSRLAQLKLLQEEISELLYFLKIVTRWLCLGIT